MELRVKGLLGVVDEGEGFSWPGELEPEGPGVEFSASLVELKVRFRGDLGEARSRERGLEGGPPCLDDFADRSESFTLGEKREMEAVGGA